jgi:putative membrane protein
MQDQAKKRPLDASTRLSFERTRLSYDRTMMSWIRTATSLITFGFGIYKFFQLEMGRGAEPNRLIGPRGFSLLMVGTGLLSLLLGTLEHWRDMRSIKAEYSEMPRSYTGIVAAFILALGILALIAVIFRR